MKKFFRAVFVVVLSVLLAFDFYGLWKFKLNGKREEQTASTGDVEVNQNAEANDSSPDDNINYTELTSKTLGAGQKLFIKNIEQDSDGRYAIKGLIFEPFEVSKEDYNSLKNGKSVEILGATYTKKQIKSNNLILKSSDEGAKDFYIKYDTATKKYILKNTDLESEIYQSTEQYVKISVGKGTTFAIDNSGKTENKKIEDVVDTHKNVQEPKEETADVDLCDLTFDKSGVCTKIIEKCI